MLKNGVPDRLDDIFMPDTEVDSFVLRFVRDYASESSSVGIIWHGVIRHVQSGNELRFTSTQDAIGFLNNYVGFATLDEQETD
jgi:hypothetical protein